MNSSRDTTSSAVLILNAQRELEVLYSARHDDAWRYIITPGFGLGWIESHQILRVVEEIDIQQAPRLHCNLVMRDLASSLCSESLSDFLVLLGRSYEALILEMHAEGFRIKRFLVTART